MPDERTLDKLEEQLDEASNLLLSKRKSRGKKEIILVIICAIGLIYFLPFTDLEQSTQIEIPAISLKVPTKYISSAFPTIITAIYLIYLYSVISYLGILLIFQKMKRQFESCIKSGAISKGILKKEDFILAYYSFFLPTPLIYRIKTELKFIRIVMAIVQSYVGIIFTVLPYLSVTLILIRVYREAHNIPLLIWNIVCVIIMLLSFIGISLSYFIERKKTKEKQREQNS